MSSSRRAPSPPIPHKPSHLKSLNALSLDPAAPSKPAAVEKPPSSATSNPFDDKNESAVATDARPQYDSSSSSSIEFSYTIESLDQRAKVQSTSTPMLLQESSGHSPSSSSKKHTIDIKSTSGESLKNPFADPNHVSAGLGNDKPNLPPRPLLPPRPSVASTISASSRRESSNSSPHLLTVDGGRPRTTSLSTLTPTVVDLKRNEQSSIYKKPPPLQASRLSTNTRKISGNDTYSSGSIAGSANGISLQASGLLRLREDLHIPNSDKCSRMLPVPEHLVVYDIQNKSHTRGLAVSGFYIITAGHSVTSL